MSIPRTRRSPLAVTHPSSDQKSVTASFSPSLSVYVFKTADLEKSYEEGQRLSSPLPASAKRWSKDLRTLDPTTADLTLGVAYNPITRKYDVTQDDFGVSSLAFAAEAAVQDAQPETLASGLFENPGKVGNL